MLTSITLLTWDGRYVLLDSEPSVSLVLSVDPLMQSVCNLIKDDYIDCIAYHLQYDSDGESTLEEDIDLISDNLASMLNDDTVVIVSKTEFRISGIENRNMGVTQHMLDIRRYYEKHPFIA